MAYKRASRENYLRLHCADVHEQCDPGELAAPESCNTKEIMHAAPNLLSDRY